MCQKAATHGESRIWNRVVCTTSCSLTTKPLCPPQYTQWVRCGWHRVPSQNVRRNTFPETGVAGNFRGVTLLNLWAYCCALITSCYVMPWRLTSGVRLSAAEEAGCDFDRAPRSCSNEPIQGEPHGQPFSSSPLPFSRDITSTRTSTTVMF